MEPRPHWASYWLVIALRQWGSRLLCTLMHYKPVSSLPWGQVCVTPLRSQGGEGK